LAKKYLVYYIFTNYLIIDDIPRININNIYYTRYKIFIIYIYIYIYIYIRYKKYLL